MLIRSVEIEKNKRNKRFEEPLSYEEKTEDEIKSLQLQIENLEKMQRKLRDEIWDENTIIDILQCENNSLSDNFSNKAKTINSTKATEFMRHKHTYKPRTNADQLFTVKFDTRFTVLDKDLFSKLSLNR